MSRVDDANEIIRRLNVLDTGIANGRAYCALLETLNQPDTPTLTGDRADAVVMVRAAILRSAIGCVMAALDAADHKRDNRASVGQILKGLKDRGVRRLLAPAAAARPSLKAIKSRYASITASDVAKKCRALRNNAVAHFLLSPAAASSLRYEELSQLQNETEALVADLFAYCGQRARFRELTNTTAQRATLFWTMLFRGASQ